MGCVDGKFLHAGLRGGFGGGGGFGFGGGGMLQPPGGPLGRGGMGGIPRPPYPQFGDDADPFA